MIKGQRKMTLINKECGLAVGYGIGHIMPDGCRNIVVVVPYGKPDRKAGTPENHLAILETLPEREWKIDAPIVGQCDAADQKWKLSAHMRVLR